MTREINNMTVTIPAIKLLEDEVIAFVERHENGEREDLLMEGAELYAEMNMDRMTTQGVGRLDKLDYYESKMYGLWGRE